MLLQHELQYLLRFALQMKSNMQHQLMNLIEKYQIRHYHASRIKQCGDNRSKVQGWISKEAQQARFEVITDLLDFNGVSVLDVGCGYGDFKEMLDQRFCRFDYIGLDQQPEFIEYAQQRYQGHLHCWFHQVDFTRYRLSEVDIVVASGVLSYRCEKPNYYMEMIQRLYAAANHAFIFNMLDQDFFNSGPLLVSHDRKQIYQQCQELCSHVTLKTGYLENDFTIVMSKVQ